MYFSRCVFRHLMFLIVFAKLSYIGLILMQAIFWPFRRKWNSRVWLYSCTDNIYGKKNIIDKLSNTEGIYMKETTDERPLIQFITHPKAVEAALVDGVCQRNPGFTNYLRIPNPAIDILWSDE